MPTVTNFHGSFIASRNVLGINQWTTPPLSMGGGEKRGVGILIVSGVDVQVSLCLPMYLYSDHLPSPMVDCTPSMDRIFSLASSRNYYFYV